MEKIQVRVFGLSTAKSLPDNYILVLIDDISGKQIPIIIGSYEAQAIFVSIYKTPPSRPYTHDLFASALEFFKVEIKEVYIRKIKDGVFCAEIFYAQNEIVYKQDARASDAIAMALRCNAPIYTTNEIIEKAGILPSLLEYSDKERLQSIGKKTVKLNKLDKKELQTKLDDAIKEEDYKTAATLRDEIKKRN